MVELELKLTPKPSLFVPTLSAQSTPQREEKLTWSKSHS